MVGQAIETSWRLSEASLFDQKRDYLIVYGGIIAILSTFE